MVVAVVAASLLLLAPVIEARSNGQMGSCDLTSTWWPNNGDPRTCLWERGVYGFNHTQWKMGLGGAGVSMVWTNAPRASPWYTIRSADGAFSDDPTSYTPGVPQDIHVRTVNYLIGNVTEQLRYIGMVLYATNSPDQIRYANTGNDYTEAHVGEWTVAPGDDFQVGATSACAQTITHTNAEQKPFHTRFTIVLPKGTGTVRFKILLKQGEQNKGNFWYPQVDLILTERNVTAPAPAPANLPAPSITVLGAPGQSCADACAASVNTTICDTNAIVAINSNSALLAALKGVTLVREQVLAGCPFAGGPYITSDGYGQFRSSSVKGSCPPAYVAAAAAGKHTPDVCYVAPLATNHAICKCTNDSTKFMPNPYTQSKSAKQSKDAASTSPAPRAAAASIPAVLLLGLGALLATSGRSGSNSRLAVLGLLALLVLLAVSVPAPVTAHNFIKSLHRASEAAVTRPCQARVGNVPHVQVIAGQTFEIEWTIGHGDYTQGPYYFAVVPIAEYDRLASDNITDIFQDYIKSAPASASTAYSGAMWEKHHNKLAGECWNDGCTSAAYYKQTSLDHSDPTFIHREQAYIDGSKPPTQYTDDDDVIQTQYLDEFNAKDKRVAYKSADYPWIEMVNAFYIPSYPSSQLGYFSFTVDIARFVVPGAHGPGDYVVFFNWAGYSDCVDVNVVAGTTPVAHRYGLASNETTPSEAVKLDHCQWTNLLELKTAPRILNKTDMSVDACIADCAAQGGYCTGVQVVRASNLAGTMATGVNYPNHPYVWNQSAYDAANAAGPWLVTPYDAGYFDPCMSNVAMNRNQWGCQSEDAAAAKINPAPDDFVFFGVLPWRNQDLQVSEDYYIVKDATDPAWYSTCFLMTSPNTFLDIPSLASAYTPPSWAVAQQCMNCDFWATLGDVKYTSVPDWTQAFDSQCANCSFVSNSAPLSAMSAVTSNYDANTAPNDATPSDSSPASHSGPSKTVIIAIAAAVGAFVLLLVIIGCVVRARSAKAAATINRMHTSGQQLTSSPLAASSTNFTAW